MKWCRRFAVLAIIAFGVSVPAWSQRQIQFTYDAAGNLVQITSLSKPDLVVSGLAVSGISQHPSGGYDIAATFTVSNVGTSPAAASWYDRGYLSATASLHDGDQQLTGANQRTVQLLPGANYAVSVTFTTTANTPAGGAYLVVKADGGIAASGQFAPTGSNVVDESNETNNVQSVMVTLPTQQPDLQLTSASLGTVTVNSSGTYNIPVTYTVTNVGGSPVQSTWFDLAYLSANSSLETTDAVLANAGSRASLAVGASYTQTITYTTTANTTAGAYTVFIKADGRGSGSTGGTITDGGFIAEGNETNNAYGLALTLPAKPDLQLTSASAGVVTVSQSGAYNIPITYTVTNVGGSAAPSTWYDLAYLSANSTLETTDATLDNFGSRAGLAAGASYTVTTTYATTTSAAPGAYTVFVKTDGRGSAMTGGTSTDAGFIAEGDEANNAYALAITLPTRPDLQLTSASTGTIVRNANGSYTIPITYTVTNIGGSAAQSSWYDFAYLSADTTLDNADVVLQGLTSRSTPLAAGATYTVTTTFTTATNATPGSFTVFIKADGRSPSFNGGTLTDGGAVMETDQSNNSYALSIVLP